MLYRGVTIPLPLRFAVSTLKNVALHVKTLFIRIEPTNFRGNLNGYDIVLNSYTVAVLRSDNTLQNSVNDDHSPFRPKFGRKDLNILGPFG